MVMITKRAGVPSFQTKDGSLIRELMHPKMHGNRFQSLAEATVPTRFETWEHRHFRSEEIYHITQGKGIMTLGKERFEVVEGDSVFIPVETPHKIKAIGDTPLKLLCCCAPPYSDEDTELLRETGHEDVSP